MEEGQSRRIGGGGDENWMDMFVEGYDTIEDDGGPGGMEMEDSAVEEDEGRELSLEFGHWRSMVSRRSVVPASKDACEARLGWRCFSVEWRSSVVLDGEVFVDGIFHLFGGESSFVLGRNGRGSRADYRLVLRRKKQVTWRDWRKKFDFGHGGEASGEHPYMRVEVPRSATGEGANLFVKEMVAKCEMYEDVWSYRKEEMKVAQDRSRGKAEQGEQGEQGEGKEKYQGGFRWIISR